MYHCKVQTQQLLLRRRNRIAERERARARSREGKRRWQAADGAIRETAPAATQQNSSGDGGLIDLSASLSSLRGCFCFRLPSCEDIVRDRV